MPISESEATTKFITSKTETHKSMAIIKKPCIWSVITTKTLNQSQFKMLNVFPRKLYKVVLIIHFFYNKVQRVEYFIQKMLERTRIV